MEKIWNYVNQNSKNEKRARAAFIGIHTLIWSVIGFLTWSVIQLFALRRLVWALCFIGYTGFFIGFIGGVLFCYRREITI